MEQNLSPHPREDLKEGAPGASARVEGETGTTVLRLAGVQTVRTIEQTAAALRAALAEAERIVVDCEDLEEVDVTLPQLLLAACRSARAAGKSFSLAAPARGVLEQVLREAGLLADRNTAVKGHDGFWQGGAA